MDIIPVAFDSMGVRSMATLVKSGDFSIFIDPGVALGPKRYGLPPHPVELEAERYFWERVKENASRCDVIVITHYHYDHHNPRDVSFLKGKTLLIKHPAEKINQSQRKRAAFFLSKIKGSKVEYADGRTFEFDDVMVKFSEPVFHGTNSRLGYVVEVLVDDGRESFLHTSDVEGPSLKHQLEFMLESSAETVFVDGPMTYMLGYRYSASSLEASINNLRELMSRTDLKTLVLDHHLTRDLKWRDAMSRVFESGEEFGVKVCSAAEFRGLKDCLLEAMRKELYEGKVEFDFRSLEL